MKRWFSLVPKLTKEEPTTEVELWCSLVSAMKHALVQ